MTTERLWLWPWVRLRLRQALLLCPLLLAACDPAPPPASDAGTQPTLAVATAIPALPEDLLSPLSNEVASRLREAHTAWSDAVRTQDPGAGLTEALALARVALAYEQYVLADMALAWICSRPGQAEAWYLWGRSALAQNQLPAARERLQTALALAPEVLPLRLQLAELLLDSGEAAAARELFGSAAADSASAAELGLRGRIALAQGDAAAAADWLQAALRAEPQASRLQYPLGLALRALGREQAATQALAARGQQPPTLYDPWWDAVQAQAGSVEALRTQAGDLALAGDHAAAARLYAQALAQQEDAATRVNLAIALARSGAVDAAEKAYREALASDPDQVAGWFGLGSLLAASGRDQAAIEAYEQALQRHPDALDTRFNLANAQQRLGQLAQAEANYRHVIDKDPARVDAQLALAVALRGQARWPQLAEHLRSALQTHPGEARIALELARVLAAAPDDAVRDAARAVSLATQLFRNERSLPHGEVLAMALAESGQWTEAIRLQQQLIDAAGGQGRRELLPRLQQRLDRYVAGQAWRLSATED